MTVHWSKSVLFTFLIKSFYLDLIRTIAQYLEDIFWLNIRSTWKKLTQLLCSQKKSLAFPLPIFHPINKLNYFSLILFSSVFPFNIFLIIIYSKNEWKTKIKKIKWFMLLSFGQFPHLLQIIIVAAGYRKMNFLYVCTQTSTNILYFY